MKIYLFVLVGVLISLITQGQVSKDEKTGFWNQGAIWVGGVMPGTLSGGTLTLGTDATINGTIEAVNNFVVSGTFFSWADMAINAGDTLVMRGNFNLGAYSSLTNNGVIVVMGDFSNNGGLNTISGTGKMVVTGNYSTNNIAGLGNTFVGPSYVYGTNSGFIGAPPFGTQSTFASTDPTLYSWVNTMFGTLPVQLVYFKGAQEDNHIVLSWQTASELNNDRFLVERSGDGKEFKTIAEVAGAGNSEVTIDYEFFDQAPMAGNSYYRLTQVDYDGKQTPFKVVSVKCTIELIETYPNPTTDFLFFSNVREKYSVAIDDLSRGENTIRLQIEQVSEGKLGVDVTDLEPGVYSIRVNDGNNISGPIRFVKQ